MTASRSVKCILRNESRHSLALAGAELAHGMFATLPPSAVPPGEVAAWEAESCGFMTGTEGHAAYLIGDTGGRLIVSWDNPFIGENAFTQRSVFIAEGEHYEAHDPMRPAALDPRRYEPEAAPPLAHGENVEVTFVLRPVQEEQEADLEEAAPDQPPPAPETRAVAHSGECSVLLRDAKAEFRKLVYVGFNEYPATSEAMALAKGGLLEPPDAVAYAAGGGLPGSELPGNMAYVTTFTPASHGKIVNEPVEAFAARLTTLDPELRSRYVALEKRCDTKENQVRVSVKYPGHAVDRRYGIRCLAVAFDHAQRELGRGGVACGDVRSAPLKRLVLSAHHCPWMVNGEVGVLWGDNGFGGNHTFERGLKVMQDLWSLGTIFTSASEQVEDLMFSACHTGYSTKHVLVPQLVDVFPSLRTVWAYESLSPSNPKSDEAICSWERASREPRAESAIVEKCRQARAKKLWLPVVWTGGPENLEPQRGATPTKVA